LIALSLPSQGLKCKKVIVTPPGATAENAHVFIWGAPTIPGADVPSLEEPEKATTPSGSIENSQLYPVEGLSLSVTVTVSFRYASVISPAIKGIVFIVSPDGEISSEQTVPTYLGQHDERKKRNDATTRISGMRLIFIDTYPLLF